MNTIINKIIQFAQNCKRLFLKTQEYHETILIALIFLLNLFFVLSRLTPRLIEINPHDGVKYIESGRLLLSWGLRDLAWGPLVAFIYAPIHLFVGNSPNWFIIEAWVGNIILFSLLWFSFYTLALQLKDYISKYVFIGILFSSIVFMPIIENQSDALFVALSSFALMNLIKFYQQGRMRNVWFASLFVGLGVLSRVETILLIVPLFIFSLLLNQKRNKWNKIVLASITPVAIILLLFVSINLLTFGHPNLGLGNKSFDSFQQNHAFLPGSQNKAAYLRGENIFGSEEEIQGSVIRAIIKNPLAIGERALANLIRMPEMFSSFFGNLQAPIVFVFSLWGLFTLIRAKETKLILLLLIWPLHAFVSLIFLSRHIIPQMSYLFLVLCGIGITYLFNNKTRTSERIVFFIASFIILFGSLLSQNKILFSTSLLFTVVSFASIIQDKNDTSRINLQTMPVMLLLIGGLMFGNGFTFPAKHIGKSEREQAIQYMQSAMPNQSNILIPYWTIAIAAKMYPIALPAHITSIDEFMSFVIKEDIVSIYVEGEQPQFKEFFNTVINKYPENFVLIFESENSNIEIYLTNFSK